MKKNKDTFRRVLYFLMRPLLRLVAWTAFRVNLGKRKNLVKGQYLVLSNHSNVIDAVTVGYMFSDPIYFVAATLIFKSLFWSRLVRFLTGIIPIDKSGFDIKALRAILKARSDGKSIGIFPEGNNTISGAPLYFGVGMAKLAKQLKLPIALCNIYGGYLTHPKWATYRREGVVAGKVVRFLSAEEVASMPVNELYSIIRRELYVDAYDIQDKEQIAYPHEKLSSGIESLLYICSECSSEGTIKSYDDYFECAACGKRMRYNEYGYIEGSRFTNTRDWDSWQLEKVYEKVKDAKDGEPIYTALDYDLIDITGDKRDVITTGNFIVYKDRVTIGDYTIPIGEIEGTALHIINCVLITSTKNINYLIFQKNTFVPSIHMWYAIDAIRGVVSQNKSGLRIEA